MSFFGPRTSSHHSDEKDYNKQEHLPLLSADAIPIAKPNRKTLVKPASGKSNDKSKLGSVKDMLSPLFQFLSVLKSLQFWYLIVNVIQAVAAQEMGFYMPPYSTFLLYATTLLYSLGFLLLAIVRKEDFSQALKFKKLIFFMGVATTVNGICFQVTNVQIAPQLTVLLQTASLPTCWLFSWIFKNRIPSKRKMVCMALVLAGALFGVLYPLTHSTGTMDQFDNGAGWIVMALIGSIATAFQNILQEQAFDDGCPKAVTLCLYNAISIPFYFVWIFFSLTPMFGTCVSGYPTLDQCQVVIEQCNDTSALFAHEADAWQCYFTAGFADVPCCGKLPAFIWVTIFWVGYVVAFALCAELLNSSQSQSDGTTTVANIQAVTVPFSAMFFWWPWLSGLGYTEFRWSILVSAAVVCGGTMLYENERSKAQTAQEDENVDENVESENATIQVTWHHHDHPHHSQQEGQSGVNTEPQADLVIQQGRTSTSNGRSNNTRHRGDIADDNAISAQQHEPSVSISAAEAAQRCTTTSADAVDANHQQQQEREEAVERGRRRRL